MPDFLNAPQAATLLGCSSVHLRRLIRSGKLKAHKVGVEYRIERSEVIALRNRLTVGENSSSQGVA